MLPGVSFTPLWTNFSAFCPLPLPPRLSVNSITPFSPDLPPQLRKVFRDTSSFLFFSLVFVAEIPLQQLVQNSCRVQALLQPRLLYRWQTANTIFVRHGGKRGRRSPRAAAAGAETSKGARSRSMYQVNATWGKGNQIFLVNWRMDRYGGIFNTIFYTSEVTC